MEGTRLCDLWKGKSVLILKYWLCLHGQERWDELVELCYVVLLVGVFETDERQHFFLDELCLDYVFGGIECEMLVVIIGEYCPDECIPRYNFPILLL